MRLKISYFAIMHLNIHYRFNTDSCPQLLRIEQQGLKHVLKRDYMYTSSPKLRTLTNTLYFNTNVIHYLIYYFLSRLSNCNLSDSSCEALSSVFSSQSSHLRVLDLSNNNLQDSGVKLLCLGLKSKHCLLENIRSGFIKHFN